MATMAGTHSDSTKGGGCEAPPVYSITTPGEVESGTPPQYNNEAPPSYESVFGRVRSMREESSGNVEFTKKLVGCVFCGTVCSILMVLFMLALPISCLVFGSLYIGECPREKYIPIYLVVAGVFGIIKAIIGIVQMVMKARAKAKREGDDDEEQEEPSGVKALRIAESPITCFLACWFIAGSVWVYRIHEDFSMNPLAPDFCNPTLYGFAFWMITVQYIIVALCLLCSCLCIIVICCMVSKSESS